MLLSDWLQDETVSADKRNKGQGPRLRTHAHPTHAHTGPVHGRGTLAAGSWAAGPMGPRRDGSPRLGTTQAAVAGILSMCVSIWDEEG